MRKVLILITMTAVVLGLVVAPAGAGGAAPKIVKAINFEFKPKNLTIAKGTKVTWKNVEGKHTVTIKSLNYDKTISANHKTVSRTFNQKGTFNYFCRFHKSFGMTGKVIVQ